MPRQPRPCPAGIPQHIIQRGNNRHVCFASNEDMAAYANWLHEASVKFGVLIHAWVLMTNHVHLLVTPVNESAISRMMQYLGRYYVPYFNYTYQRSGTLWEGRFKSCLVQADAYLLACHRYIELNPVRAGMVKDPADYIWSSYRANALGLTTKLRTPHPVYEALGASKQERLSTYRALFEGELNHQCLTDIREAVNCGLVLGTDRFKDEVEQMHGQKVRLQKRGPKPKATGLD